MREFYLQNATLVVLAGCLISGCGDAPGDSSAPSTTETVTHTATAPLLSPRQSQMWADSCALCHVDGTAGAPRLGHPDEWADRVKQGQDVLLKHTLEGLNDMPPLGYCMACEVQDFEIMIRFMAAQRSGDAT